MEVGDRHVAPQPRQRGADGRDLIGTLDRARTVAVAVHGEQHLGSTWLKRSTTLRTPNSGAHEVQMAPRLAVASSATSASGTFGR